ncbi:MAG: LPS export ABC transporter ATP-binding protein [candidate division NC10 bacterium]|nr:LPS export ABC transporter ATP-binding protein [candidate division NC10 bacterium]
MDLLVKAQNLRKSFHRREVVSGVSLEVGAGEVVGLLGPNGAGKTTTFYMILGLLRPNAGKVFLGEEEITHLPVYLRARKGIGYLSQEPSVFRKLTVEENLRAVLEIKGVGEEEGRQRTEGLLKELNISHLAHSKAYTLSGGERRRVEIARSLAGSPSFILLDEPFAGLDPLAILDIQGIISELKRKGIGVLVTDHNVRETLSAVDRAYLIFGGKILFHGPAEELAKDDRARELYLGDGFSL